MRISSGRGMSPGPPRTRPDNWQCGRGGLGCLIAHVFQDFVRGHNVVGWHGELIFELYQGCAWGVAAPSRSGAVVGWGQRSS